LCKFGVNVKVIDGLVSVVMPVYNGERFVSRTLASALAQTYQTIEVVVIDDGSTDRTPFFIEAAAARDKRVRLFRTPNAGVAKARNLAISKAQGELIAPLDADDLWHPEKIARQIAVMQASSAEVGLVYCWAIDIDENDFVIATRVPTESENEFRARITPRGGVTEELVKSNFLGNGSTPLIKRSCIEAVGGYDTNLLPAGAEDWKLYLALSDICEFAVAPEYLVGYRQSTESKSRDIATMAQSMNLVRSWIFKKWPMLSEEVMRLNRYHTNTYLVSRAIESNRFWAALGYRMAAYRARPAALLETSNLKIDALLLARMAGLRHIVRRRKRTPVLFRDFRVPFPVGNYETN
jgi:glycosyltransferase involved in cell wall biosynthesis